MCTSFPLYPSSEYPYLEHHTFFVIFQHHVSLSMCCLSVSSDSWNMLCWKVGNKEAPGHFNSERLCSSLLPSYVHCSFLLPLLWLPVILDGSLQWYSCWVVLHITVTCVFLDPFSHWCFSTALSGDHLSIEQYNTVTDFPFTSWSLSFELTTFVQIHLKCFPLSSFPFLTSFFPLWTRNWFQCCHFTNCPNTVNWNWKTGNEWSSFF